MNAFLTKILLATDESTDAILAAWVATEVTKGTGSELHIVHVLEPFPRHAYPGMTPEVYSYVLDKSHEVAHHLLNGQAEHIADGGGTVTETDVRRGPVPDAIPDLIQKIGARLVLMGSRGLVGMLSSFDLLKLVEQHRSVMKPGPIPSRKGTRRQ